MEARRGATIEADRRRAAVEAHALQPAFMPAAGELGVGQLSQPEEVQW